ncbi:MAG: Phosphatidylglycerophosphatase A [Tenericutes bacterium ADurb.Bin087]|nr:MAG: Phosphatidylglycerophosphatase A [Tenericutes bacterium ADurb.Bin087]
MDHETRNRMNDEKKYVVIVDRLERRGVTELDIADITYHLQIKYIPDLEMDVCLDHVKRVLKKREVQNAILTGLELDILAEKGMLSEPLQTIIASDYGLYGIDEILALSIVNVYGSIGSTNFGYVDKVKPGIMGELDDKTNGTVVNTFLDDIVGAIAAAAASSIAHKYADADFDTELYKKQ